MRVALVEAEKAENFIDVVALRGNVRVSLLQEHDGRRQIVLRVKVIICHEKHSSWANLLHSMTSQFPSRDRPIDDVINWT